MALDLSQLRRLFGNNSGQRMTMSPPLLELSEEEDERLANLGKIDPSDVSITTPGLLAPDLPEPATSSTGMADSILGRVNQGRLRANKTPFASTDDAWEAKDTGVYMGPTSMEDRIASSADPSVKGFSPDLLSGTGMRNYLLMQGELPRGPIDERGEPLSPEAARDLQRLPEATEEELAITEPALARTRAGLSPFPLRGGLDSSTPGELLEEDPLFLDTAKAELEKIRSGGLLETDTTTAGETVSQGPQMPEIPLFMKAAANQVQEQAGPELPEQRDLIIYADTVLANEGMRTESYDDITVDAETKEERSSGWAVGAGQHRYYPPDGGPSILVEEGMNFTEEELLASADREMKEVTVPGIINLIPEGSWDTLTPEAQAQLVSVAWNYGLGSHTFLGKDHSDPEKAKMGDRLFTTALREGDWDAMGDAIRDLAGDNADKDGYARNGKRRIAEGDAFDAAMAGGGTDILGGFRETLSGFPGGFPSDEASDEGMFSSEPHQYVNNIRRRRETEQEAERAAELEGYRDWLRLPRQRGRQADELTMKTFLAESEIPETISDSPYSSSQRSKDQAEIQRNNDWDDYIVGQADLAATLGLENPEKAKIHWQNIEVARKMRQMDTPGAILGTLPGPDIPGMRPTKKTLQDIGGEVTAEHRFQFLEEEDDLPEQEDIIGSTEAGATDEALTGLPADIDEPPTIGESFQDQLEAQAGLIDSRAISSSAVSGAVPGSQDARPQRRGLLDDRLAIAQALAQLSAGVAQGGLFGDITDTGEVRGGLVNVMPGAIQTLRTAQENATGEDIPDSNWGVGPAKEEQLFYIGPGGSITWVKDNEGNYVLKSSTDGGSGSGGGSEKKSMAQALITMTTDAGIDLMDYYINNYNLSSGEMLGADGEDVSYGERLLTRANAAYRDMLGKDQTRLPNYGAAKQAAALMGEGFLRMTTGAAYNAQEYGNAMDLFWVKATDSPDKKLFKWKMAAQFGPMMQIMANIDSKEAMADARINNKKLNAMREMMLKGLAEGKIGGTAEQRTALSVALQLPPETETMEWEDTIGDT